MMTFGSIWTLFLSVDFVLLEKLTITYNSNGNGNNTDKPERFDASAVAFGSSRLTFGLCESQCLCCEVGQ